MDQERILAILKCWLLTDQKNHQEIVAQGHFPCVPFGSQATQYSLLCGVFDALRNTVQSAAERVQPTLDAPPDKLLTESNETRSITG